MKICVAQAKAVKGDIISNIANHKKLIGLAIEAGADCIFFPELSITGYEPELANELATGADDNRLNIFEDISDKNNITIGIGMPLRSANGIQISMIIFQPNIPRQVYAKQHLHSDEIPFFTNGDKQVFINNDNQKIAPGICYETSLPVHWSAAAQAGANIYVASVAKTAAGVERSTKFFSAMAKQYSMTVLLCNSIGPADNFLSCGNSSVWNNKGEMLARLNDTDEGILIFDTDSGQAVQKIIEITI
jgi:predicted amidohydrolase